MKRLFPLALLLVAAPLAAQPAAPFASLYADVKARAVGDPITIVLAERTNAQRQSRFEDRSEGGFGGSAALDGVAGRFGADARFSADAAARNQTVQSDLLTGAVTALVTEVLPGGTLRVEGERRLNVNGVTHYMKVEGLVRPADVRGDNSVLSFQIANADVVYRQDGLGQRWFSPGALVRLGALALLVAAAIVGGT